MAGRANDVVMIRLFGGVSAVTDRAVPVDVGAARTQAVLAVLALSPQTAVPVARLVDLVWGDEPPRTAEKTLQWHVAQLRRGLGPDAIVRTGAAYRLDVPPDAVDVVRFQRLLAAGEVGKAPAEESLILGQDERLSTQPVRTGNLPLRLDGLVGRAEELAALVADMARSRVVTLVGPGGIGKTSLALAAASTVATERPGGVWLAELGEISSSRDVPPRGRRCPRGLGASWSLTGPVHCRHTPVPAGADSARQL
jgi:hypothetical protein